ncbi:hypothetical protein OC845_006412, partial [Tilletia horrida]
TTQHLSSSSKNGKVRPPAEQKFPLAPPSNFAKTLLPTTNARAKFSHIDFNYRLKDADWEPLRFCADNEAHEAPVGSPLLLWNAAAEADATWRQIAPVAETGPGEDSSDALTFACENPPRPEDPKLLGIATHLGPRLWAVDKENRARLPHPWSRIGPAIDLGRHPKQLSIPQGLRKKTGSIKVPITLVSGSRCLDVRVYAFTTTKRWIHIPRILALSKAMERLLEHARDDVSKAGRASCSSKRLP